MAGNYHLIYMAQKMERLFYVCMAHPASKFMFENFHELAKKFNFSLIAPSRPGIGKSSYKIFNRLSDYSEDIKELMAKQNISSCHLIGVSGGGPYAFALANSIPENFLSLNLISALGPIDKKNLKKWVHHKS